MLCKNVFGIFNNHPLPVPCQNVTNKFLLLTALHNLCNGRKRAGPLARLNSAHRLIVDTDFYQFFYIRNLFQSTLFILKYMLLLLL